MDVENNIPKHWGKTKASEVGKLLRGVNYKKEESNTEAKNGYLPVLRGNNINGELNFEDLVYVQQKNINKEQLIKSGDIVFAMSSGSKHLVGKSAKAKADFNGSFGAFCGVFRPNENFNKNFVAYFFQSPYYKKVISEISKGTNINNLKREHILGLDFPIPPLPEQQAIVAKIEELLSELENGKQQLQTAQQQLKVYRQSLLKWAFEGKLTNKKVKDGELPKGWKLKELKEITSVLGDGLHGTPKYSETGDYYFINGNNLNDGKIEIKENTKRVSLEEYNKYKKPLNENTIFVSINGSLGYTAFYNNENVVLGKSACYFNVLETINKFYIRYFLTSSRFNSYANKNATGSTIKNVGLKTMRELQIPIPATIEEQKLIVDELESKLTVCDKIEETISQSLQQAETLRQSILKKAFEGKLVEV